MKQDIPAGMTFDDVFSMYVLLETPHKSVADQQEKYEIKKYSATDTSKGYNTLRGSPVCDPKYYWIRKTNTSK
jgi:hypothetical protein